VKLPTPKRSRGFHQKEGGYVLLTLLLMVTMIAIGLVVVLPSITFEIRRDQESELIHRGVQYSRAIRAYYKKFGRYPTRIEDLQSTNNLRFLRKRYKDPMNCKESKCEDFKILHFGDPGVKLSLTGGIPGGAVPGASTPGTPGTLNASVPNGLGAVMQQTGFANQNAGFGSTSTFTSTSNPASNPSTSNQQGTDSSAGTSTNAGTDSSNSSSQKVSGTPGDSDTSSSNQQVFGGSAFIVGVASLCKKDTIREFNKKKKYNEWQFVYDPATDRGGLLMTPYQPTLQSFNQNQNQTGQPGQPGQPGQLGTSSPFGNNPGTNVNPSNPATPPQTDNPSQQ
jgi:type II secretory pathway pseudopilin PulG